MKLVFRVLPCLESHQQPSILECHKVGLLPVCWEIVGDIFPRTLDPVIDTKGQIPKVFGNVHNLVRLQGFGSLEDVFVKLELDGEERFMGNPDRFSTTKHHKS
jgi:hypothetical protein